MRTTQHRLSLSLSDAIQCMLIMMLSLASMLLHAHNGVTIDIAVDDLVMSPQAGASFTQAQQSLLENTVVVAKYADKVSLTNHINGTAKCNIGFGGIRCQTSDITRYFPFAKYAKIVGDTVSIRIPERIGMFDKKPLVAFTLAHQANREKAAYFKAVQLQTDHTPTKPSVEQFDLSYRQDGRYYPSTAYTTVQLHGASFYTPHDDSTDNHASRYIKLSDYLSWQHKGQLSDTKLQRIVPHFQSRSAGANQLKEAVHEGNRIVSLSVWGGIDEQSSAFKALSPIQQSRCDDAHVVYNALFVNDVLVNFKSRRVDMDKPTDASRKQLVSKSGYDNRLLPRCRMSGYEMVRDNQHNVIAYRRISPVPDKYIDYTHVSGLSQTMPASLGTVEHNEKLIKKWYSACGDKCLLPKPTDSEIAAIETLAKKLLTMYE